LIAINDGRSGSPLVIPSLEVLPRDHGHRTFHFRILIVVDGDVVVDYGGYVDVVVAVLIIGELVVRRGVVAFGLVREFLWVMCMRMAWPPRTDGRIRRAIACGQMGPPVHIVDADVVPGVVVIMRSKREPADAGIAPDVADGKTEEGGAAAVGKGNQGRTPHGPDRLIGDVHDVCGNPAPSIGWRIDPAPVVVGHPAPRLIGNPGPAKGLSPHPAAIAVRRPIDNRNPRSPDPAVFLDFDPISVLVEITIAGNPGGNVFTTDNRCRHCIAHVAPAIEIVVRGHVGHLQLGSGLWIGRKCKFKPLTARKSDGVILPYRDQRVAPIQ
jgi:hypothetical protein